MYVCPVFGITYDNIVSTARAHTHHLPRAHLYVSILTHAVTPFDRARSASVHDSRAREVYNV